MTSSLLRVARFALASLTVLGLVPQVWAAPATPAAASLTNSDSWLYKGSDIPPDPAWTFGVLPNGLRYAVRNNGVPPRQVSIRIGIEAGSLMESDTELGYAHFIEHLVFRGSAYLQDGEAKRVWQRLGASFGSDTNASTTTTQTIYKIDVPDFNTAGLDESMKILSGMMMGPTLTPAEVDAERRTVMAEAREQFGPEFEANVASRKLFFAGQLFSTRSPIGTVESLQSASSASIRAFHSRWYRPERAIIVVSGDGDPAQFEALIKKYFSIWAGKGPSLPDPDFGKPQSGTPATAVVAAAGLPLGVQLGYLRPWYQKNDTIAYNQGKLVDLVATYLINRRLETRARAGGSFLQAQVGQDDVARSVDATFVSIMPLGDDWKSAVRDVRAVIADAIANPADKAEIEREANEFYSALQVGVETERTQAASKLADDIIEAVNIRETVATSQVAFDVFAGMKDKITPAMIQASTKRLFSGVGPRAIITAPAAIPNGQADLASAINAPINASLGTRSTKPALITDLPSLGKPGVIAKTTPLAALDLTISEFTNGVKMVHFANPAETGKVYVTVRYGNGMKSLPANRKTAAWAAPLALFSSGIDRFGADQLDRMTSGRRINVSTQIGDDAFMMRGETRGADLTDQLRLMATKMVYPRWDAGPINRARAAILANYDGAFTSPTGVLSRELGGLLRGNDLRWAAQSKDDINALTPAAFRSLWEPILKSGPIEVMVFGDVTYADAEKAVAASFGAMKPRKATPAISGAPPAFQANTQPDVRYHKGQPDQAAAVLAWPTGGGIDQLSESRKLEVLALIFGDRMFDQLREAEGASYSPIVDSDWPIGLDRGGNFAVIAQLKPEGVDHFFDLTRNIASDLAKKPVTPDEMTRAIKPLIERITRASTGSQFWMRHLEGSSTDPRRIDAIRGILADYRRITPADLQATAQKWLGPNKAYALKVVPQKK
jgi:zinc protease